MTTTLADPIAPARPVRVTREPRLAECVAVVGGHPGCGKGLLTPILASLERVELPRYNFGFEHLCGLHVLGALGDDAAAAMVRMQMDLDLYNVTMARETNFRWSDLTGVFRNPNPWRYMRRALGPGDAVAVDTIRATRPILQIVAHNVLALCEPMFLGLGPALRIIELVRHPLYLLKAFFLYIERYGTDVRDFTLWFDYEGRALPFFARGWEARYVAASPMDRSIYAIAHLSRLGEESMARLSPERRAQILLVPFERFVLTPQPWMERIQRLLQTRPTRWTARELRRQKVPRARVADGVALPVFKRHGWEPPQQGATERDELAARRAFAARHASAEALAVLDRLSAEYEAAHLDGGRLLEAA